MPGNTGDSGTVLMLGWDLALTDYVKTGSFGGAPGARLGTALAYKQDVVVAGAPGYGDNGAVFVYVCCDPDDQWIEWQRIDSPATFQADAEFGGAVAITPDGRWIAVGSPLVDRVTSPGARTDVGAVYLYEHVGLTWQFHTLLRPPGAGHNDHFGTSVAMYDRHLVAGSPGEDGAEGNEGAAYVFHLAGDAWETVPRQRLVASGGEQHDGLGTTVAAGPVGALVGAPRADGEGVLDAGEVLFFRHAGAFFVDGFESGGSAFWSVTSP
jgi:hypothetical protein